LSLRGKNNCRQSTSDHTVAAELARYGIIAPGEVDRHPYRHRVNNVLGGATAGVQAEVRRTDLEAGDVMLLCSDGLTDMLDDERIAAVLKAEREPQTACERLVAKANGRGGRDNVTAVVARFEAC
jgi:PPM family protein phosphatase